MLRGCMMAIAAICAIPIVVAAVTALSPGGVLSSARPDRADRAGEYCAAAAAQMPAAGYGDVASVASAMAITHGPRAEFACIVAAGGQRYAVRVRAVCGEPFDCAAIDAIQESDGALVWARAWEGNDGQ